MSQETCNKTAEDQPFPKFKLILPSNHQSQKNNKSKDVDNDDTESQETYFSEAENKNDEIGTFVSSQSNGELNDLVSQITVNYPDIFNAIDEFTKNNEDCIEVEENMLQNGVSGHCKLNGDTRGTNHQHLSENLPVCNVSTESSTYYNGANFEKIQVGKISKQITQLGNTCLEKIDATGLNDFNEFCNYSEYPNKYPELQLSSTDVTLDNECSQIVRLKLRKVAPDSEEWGIKELILTDNMNDLKIRDDENCVECTENENSVLSEYSYIDDLNIPDDMLTSDTTCFGIDNDLDLSSSRPVVERRDIGKNLSQITGTSQQNFRGKYKSKGKKLFEDKEEWKKYLWKIGKRKKLEKVSEFSSRKLRSDRRLTRSVSSHRKVEYPDKKQQFTPKKGSNPKKGRPRKNAWTQNKRYSEEESPIEKSRKSSGNLLVSPVQKKPVSSTFKKIQGDAYDELFMLRQEVSDWLRGWAPPKYKAEVKQLLKSVENYRKELLHHPSKYRLNEQRKLEVEQVAETLMYQLKTVLEYHQTGQLYSGEEMWCNEIMLMVPDSEEIHATSSVVNEGERCIQTYSASEETDETPSWDTLNGTENVTQETMDLSIDSSYDREPRTQFLGRKGNRKKSIKKNTQRGKKIVTVVAEEVEDSLTRVQKNNGSINIDTEKETQLCNMSPSRDDSATLFLLPKGNKQKKSQKTIDIDNEIKSTSISQENTLVSFPEQTKNRMSFNASTKFNNKSATEFLPKDNNQQMTLQGSTSKSSSKAELISTKTFIPTNQQNSVKKFGEQTKSMDSCRPVTYNLSKEISDETATQFSVIDSDEQMEVQETTDKSSKTEFISKENNAVTQQNSVTNFLEKTTKIQCSQQMTSNTLTELNDESMTQFTKVDKFINSKFTESNTAKNICNLSVGEHDDQNKSQSNKSTEYQGDANGFKVPNISDVPLTNQVNKCSSVNLGIQTNIPGRVSFKADNSNHLVTKNADRQKLDQNPEVDHNSQLCSQSLLQNCELEKVNNKQISQQPKIKEMKKSIKHKSRPKTNTLYLDAGEKSPKIQKTKDDENNIIQSNPFLKGNKKQQTDKFVNHISNSQPIKEKKSNLKNSSCSFRSLSQPVSSGKKSVTFTLEENGNVKEPDINATENSVQNSENSTFQNPKLDFNYIVVHPTSDLIPYSEFREGFFDSFFQFNYI